MKHSHSSDKIDSSPNHNSDLKGEQSTTKREPEKATLGSRKPLLKAFLEEARARIVAGVPDSSQSNDFAQTANYGRNFENYARNFENYARNFENYARSVVTEPAPPALPLKGTLPNGAPVPDNADFLLSKGRSRQKHRKDRDIKRSSR